MNLPLVSICVPVYNVVPYIERCVRSLMEQTYQNLEYIFVNDCSTDDSLSVLRKVLQDYPDRKQNTIIVNNDCNHGLAYTRRISIEHATGEYITCVDSDDYIDKEMVQCMIDKAIQTQADIVTAGYYNEWDATTEIIEPYPIDQETDYIRLVLSDLLNSMCSRLFLRSLFSEGNNCYAPERMDYMEDKMAIFFLSTKARRIVSINKPLYHYAIRHNSISQNISERHWKCLIRFFEEAERRLEELKLIDKYKDILGTHKIQMKAHHLMLCDNRSRKQYADLYAEEERLYKPKLTRGVALMYWLTKHHLWGLTYCYQCYINWLEHKTKR
ncbi:MAG: glycosyltransferase family 2 protein [Paludibacteraceae bacterium]|nr:glycosyltransferase family 2 protein [Paludibacteraceae bacterium]